MSRGRVEPPLSPLPLPFLSGCLSTLRIRPASRTVCQFWPAGTGLSPPSHAFLPSLTLCWPLARNCAKSIKLFANWWHNFAALRSTVHLTVCLSVPLSTHLAVCLSVPLSAYLPVCLSVPLYLRPSVSLAFSRWVSVQQFKCLVGAIIKLFKCWQHFWHLALLNLAATTTTTATTAAATATTTAKPLTTIEQRPQLLSAAICICAA